MTFQEALLRKGVRFRKSGSDPAKILLCCPYCPERGKGWDTQYRLCVHAVQGWGRCLHCNWKHRYAVAPVLKQLGLLAEGVYLGTEAEEEVQRRNKEPVQLSLPRDFQRLHRVFDDLDKQARNYVLERGITPEQIRQHKIGVSYTGRYAYRIIFPIFVDSQLRGINARDFTGQQQPKYLLSRGEKYLYNLDPKAQTVILSEGVIKALRIAQAAPDACSASLLGHNLTEAQLEQLRTSACQQVIVYPDAEPVGYRGAAEIAARLAAELESKQVSVIRHVTAPADEAPLGEIRTSLLQPSAYSHQIYNQLLRGR